MKKLLLALILVTVCGVLFLFWLAYFSPRPPLTGLTREISDVRARKVQLTFSQVDRTSLLGIFDRPHQRDV